MDKEKEMKVTSIQFRKDRKSITIKLDKEYTHLGIGPAEIAELLLKFHNNYDKATRATFYKISNAFKAK